jgi:type VI secretion system protein ImpK
MLRQGKPLSVEAVQSDLRSKLRVSRQVDSLGQPDDEYLGIRYALVCWLDELFIIDSPWQSDWAAKALEPALYHTRSRASTFWEQASKASARSDRAALEVYTLCVLLGFRGELRENLRELRDRRDQLETQSGLRGRVRWADEPAETPVPPAEVPILTASGQLRWLLFGFVAVLFGAIITAGFLAVNSLK